MRIKLYFLLDPISVPLDLERCALLTVHAGEVHRAGKRRVTRSFRATISLDNDLVVRVNGKRVLLMLRCEVGMCVSEFVWRLRSCPLVGLTAQITSISRSA